MQKQGLTLTLEDGDLMETVRAVVSLMLSRATVKKIELRVDGPPTVPLRYDSYVLTVILENLLSNALKFTAENGRIDLDIELTEQWCVLRVTDNGVGIDEDKVERIREGKAVASERGSAMEFGHGLGLDLCQRLIRLHGGRFDVYSALGKGSTFTVEIPA